MNMEELNVKLENSDEFFLYLHDPALDFYLK